jgi:3-oxoacyl-[acyl-carrier protein] reductase
MPRPYALVTGGTAGIGFAISKKLIHERDLVLVYRSNRKRAEESRSALLHLYPAANVWLFEEDLNCFENCQRVYVQIISKLNASPEVLVHCAGRHGALFFLACEFSQAKNIIDEHLVAAMAMCHLVLPDMYSQRKGNIILIGSTSAHTPGQGQASYAASKGALEGFALALSKEILHRGITINCVAPGIIDTDMTKNIINRIQAKNPGFVPGRPEDVANVVNFLVSSEAASLSGETIFLKVDQD